MQNVEKMRKQETGLVRMFSNLKVAVSCQKHLPFFVYLFSIFRKQDFKRKLRHLLHHRSIPHQLNHLPFPQIFLPLTNLLPPHRVKNLTHSSSLFYQLKWIKIYILFLKPLQFVTHCCYYCFNHVVPFSFLQVFFFFLENKNLEVTYVLNICSFQELVLLSLLKDTKDMCITIKLVMRFKGLAFVKTSL